MALIKCPECGKEISNSSHQCIHCGYPLNCSSKPYNQQQQQVVTIQKTSKDIKKESAGGCVMYIISGLLFFIGLATGNPAILIFSGIGFVIAIVLRIDSGVKKWWHHD